ncbi:MAG: hypothetical protein RL701_5559 [Pseudomonadota bacterium]|jgi:cytochrome c oxidase assembly protein subunit 15
MAEATQTPRVVRGWLLTLWFLVLAMVMVGGITRLTGSGLSIVEWRPVTGVLPPLTDADWRAAFDAYKHSPQFVQQNSWMSLHDFQQIFFWEYLHRLLGRAIGVVTIVPWLYFVLRGVVTKRVAARTFSIVVLGGLQGVLGWWMVKSGLVNEPRVSHYRLAAHLLLAMCVGQWILWQAVELLAQPSATPVPRPSARLRWAALGLVPLVLVQLAYGAFMAGLHAGHMAATFPDMNGQYAPQHFFLSDSWRINLIDSPWSVHYLHRVLACVLLAYVGVLAGALRRSRPELRATAWLLVAAVLGQAFLGALTVLLHVPIGVAVAHQGGAYILFSALVLFLHAVFAPASATADTSRDQADSIRPAARARVIS